MAVIKAILKTSKESKTNLAPVYVSFYINREKVEIPCKLSVNIDDWDKAGQCIKGNSNIVRDNNLIINNIRSKVSNILVKYRLMESDLTKETFYREYNNPTDFRSFYDFCMSYLRVKAREVEPNTYKKHLSVIRKMRTFSETAHFDEITPDWLKLFAQYMRKTHGNKESTVNKDLAVIKSYVLSAFSKGYMRKNPFLEFKIKQVKNNYVYLDDEELAVFYNAYKSKDISDKYYPVLRFFLFMCFTSLHITDSKMLDIKQISESEFVYYRIKNRHSKPEPITIPLSDPAKSIIGEVRGDRKSGKLFDGMISDVKINLYLKDIAKELGIDKRISAKTGRHSFASIFIKNTKDLPTLQKLLGHSNLRETMLYAHVMDKSLVEGIQCFNVFK